MKFAIVFVIGALFGSIVALMFAPSSGDELRSNIKSQADVQSARLQEQWQQKYLQLQNRIDKMSGELQDLTKKTTEVDSAI